MSIYIDTSYTATWLVRLLQPLYKHDYPLCMCVGEVISLSVNITMKIAKSRHLGILATRKHNQNREKLAWMCFESFFGMVHEHHK